ncbi:unnamed protein product [Phytomonas sp. EM1]|nr:unnamed protein product [Phytomonas sp. EM1]|eukprot:CCW60701.1 unnamed protein product [Phytomonas sp. isolate EM1]
MDTTIDDLIDEIFKEEDKTAIGRQQTSGWDSSDSSTGSISPRSTTGRQSSLDKALHKHIARKGDPLEDSGALPSRSGPLAPFSIASKAKAKDFDDTSEEEGVEDRGLGGGDPPVRVKPTPLASDLCRQTSRSCHPTPPFPTLPAAGLVCCAGRCYVTNVGAALAFSRAGKSPFPTVEGLIELSNGLHARGASSGSLMFLKGAFYVSHPELGNGCLDGNTDADRGGCPHILCLKCNYVVIRLQGAEWVDDDGRFDLYLTTRNYYPDWARLAGSSPFGDRAGKTQNSVLRTNPDAAAYCCQCSCLTVRASRVGIETKLTDVALAGAEKYRFATELPLLPNEKQRRPPLWVCKGHYVAMGKGDE